MVFFAEWRRGASRLLVLACRHWMAAADRRRIYIEHDGETSYRRLGQIFILAVGHVGAAAILLTALAVWRCCHSICLHSRSQACWCRCHVLGSFSSLALLSHHLLMCSCVANLHRSCVRLLLPRV